MIEKIRAIVTDIIRHNDKSNVVVTYTRERGRMVFISPVATTRGRTSRNAKLMPLAAIEADVNISGNREMYRLGSFSLLHPWQGIYSHPLKTTIAIFLREFLGKLLRESPPDSRLWDCLYSELAHIDSAQDQIASLHIRFLSRLLPFMGIQPDITQWMPGAAFDMREGAFVSRLPMHADILVGDNTSIPMLWNRFINEDFNNDEPEDFPQIPNRHVLNVLLKYYAIHFPGLSDLKSPDILADIFQ